MKTFIMISWRNLWRNKKRSLVVISSIAIGIFAMIFSMGFMNGMNSQMVENTIKTSLGHIAIHRKGFQDEMKLRYNFFPEEKILDSIKKNPLVKDHAPRVKVQGMIRSSESSRGVLIFGINPIKEKLVSNIFNYTSKEEGSRYLGNEDADSILISESNARKLNLQVGDRMVVMLQDREKEIIGTGLTVTGIFSTPVESFDKYVVYMNIKKLQEITGLGENISELTLILKDRKTVDEAKDEITKSINSSSLEVLSWKDMAPNLVSAVKLFDQMIYIFFMIIFITVIFTVANTLIMAIMERFHEIGVMKSIGTKPSWIFNMVMFEAVNLGIAGLCAGIVLGLILIQILGVTGIDLSFYTESMRMFGSGGKIYPLIKTLDIAVAVTIVLITTIIAAFYPAVKAARIKPLDALHYV